MREDYCFQIYSHYIMSLLPYFLRIILIFTKSGSPYPMDYFYHVGFNLVGSLAEQD